MRLRRVGIVLVCLLALAGCAGAPSGPGGPDGGAHPLPDGDPPPVVLLMPDGDIELSAWTYCWSGEGTGGCADGAPPEDPATVGSPESVTLGFARTGWDFQATFTERGPDDSSGGESEITCPRSLTTDAVPLTDTTFRLDPIGEAGTWTVDLFGAGPEGDVATTFVWTTTALAPVEPEIESGLAVLANNDGEPDSYGVELYVSGMALSPDQASAVITVSDAVGGEVTIEMTPYVRGEYCRAGAIWLEADPAAGLAAVPLAANGPVTYAVDLTLGGQTYTGLGSWSLDLPEGENLHVPLTWTPPLPAYEAG